MSHDERTLKIFYLEQVYNESLTRQTAQVLTKHPWFQIDWNLCRRRVRSLQRRIVKSLQAGDWRKVKSLCSLLVNSFSAQVLAVKRVTENKGKRTAGIDGQRWTSPAQKMQAVNTIATWKRYHPHPLKRIYIPKKGSTKMRPISIPVMEDRARQALLAFGLQAITETLADGHSYGFRPKRGCADAMAQVFNILRQQSSASWILEGDIKGFFDNIAFDWMLTHIPMNKRILKAWLQCGFIDKGEMFETTDGVPQGGIISPIIANRVLDGLASEVSGRYHFRRTHQISFVRYADDFIVTANSEAILRDVIIPKINTFLAVRGVELSPHKTHITHIRDGFDFLGQTTRKYSHQGYLGKIQITPSLKAMSSIKDNIKTLVKSSGCLTQAQLIDRLNPVLRGWANYHRHVICGEAFSQLDNFVWFRLFRWAKRRHPDKTGRWIALRYFCIQPNAAWIFKDKKSGKALIRVSQAILTQRHIKVKADANPFDGEWEAYFTHREQMLKIRSVNKYIGKVLKRQCGRCPRCRQLITVDDDHQLYHLDGCKTNKGIMNVLLIHRNCNDMFVVQRESSIVNGALPRGR